MAGPTVTQGSDLQAEAKASATITDGTRTVTVTSNNTGNQPVTVSNPLAKLQSGTAFITDSIRTVTIGLFDAGAKAVQANASTNTTTVTNPPDPQASTEKKEQQEVSTTDGAITPSTERNVANKASKNTTNQTGKINSTSSIDIPTADTAPLEFYEKMDWLNTMVKRKNRQDYEDYTFESMSGATSVVIFEFPNHDKNQGSWFMVMRSIVSLSVSVHRAKIPITPLGFSTIQGFALGNKTVAGSIIKTLTFDDEFDQLVSYFRVRSQKEREFFLYTLGSKGIGPVVDSRYHITHKEFDSIMRDDLIPFNIHTYAISEYTGHRGRILINSIYGCTLINEGQVQSIENLITENTFSYIAKNAELGKTLHNQDPESGLYASYPTINNVKTDIDLLSSKK